MQSVPVSHTPSEDRQITPSLTELAGHLMRRLGHGVGFDDRHPERLLELAEDLGLLRPGIFPAYRGWLKQRARKLTASGGP